MAIFDINAIKASIESKMAADKAATVSPVTTGLNQATATMQPTINQSTQYSNSLNDLLMGNTPMSSIPGYENMVSGRTDAISDLSTNMAGGGKFFSGTMGQGAADIGGAMSNDLVQQYITNLMGAAQPGQQMQSNLAGYQMGAGQTLASNDLTQQQINAGIQATEDANKSSMWGDILGLAGTAGGFLMGGPVGAAVGSKVGSTIGGNA